MYTLEAKQEAEDSHWLAPPTCHEYGQLIHQTCLHLMITLRVKQTVPGNVRKNIDLLTLHMSTLQASD